MDFYHILLLICFGITWIGIKTIIKKLDQMNETLKQLQQRDPEEE